MTLQLRCSTLTNEGIVKVRTFREGLLPETSVGLISSLHLRQFDVLWWDVRGMVVPFGLSFCSRPDLRAENALSCTARWRTPLRLESPTPSPPSGGWTIRRSHPRGRAQFEVFSFGASESY